MQAIEVEPTFKPIAGGPDHGLAVVSRAVRCGRYLTAPAARRVILRAAASLLRWEQSMLAIRDPPAVAFTPEQRVERRGLALVNVGGKSGS